MYIREGFLKVKKFKLQGEAKGVWGSAKSDQLHTCFLLEDLLMICKFNDKGSKIPYKLVFYVSVTEIEKVAYSPQSKAKSAVVINLAGEGLIQLNAKDTDEAKEWVADVEKLISKKK